MSKNLEGDTPPSVIFVVVNWNQCQLTLDCLASLKQIDYPDFSIVLVDNGSKDGSVVAVKESFPEVIMIENNENLGIATANNIGIRRALELEADYVFLLNNDTTVDLQMLSQLVMVAESAPEIAATGPTMYYFDQPQVIWSAGANVDMKTGDTVRFRSDEVDNPKTYQEQKPVEVNVIASCGLCIKRRALEDVGLMDDRYFIYYDEADWCVRAIAHGWKILYVPQAKMWHKVSASMGTTSPATSYYMTRNLFLFLAKNLANWSRIQAIMRVFMREIRIILAFSIKTHQGQRIPNRNARLMALRDIFLGRWGKMGLDVAAVCYPHVSND